MRIIYVCHYGQLSGFGRAARDYLAALDRAGHELAIVDWRSFPGAPAQERAVSPEPRYQHLDRLVLPWPERHEVPLEAVAIYHAQPRLLAAVAQQVDARQLPWISGVANIAMTTWETSDFPPEFANPLLDTFGGKVIVPSEFCREVIAGRVGNASVVPHTFDPAWWRPSDHVLIPGPEFPLRFYSMGAWTERKNHMATIAAFLHAFTRGDHVRLTIAAHDADADAVRSLCARSGLRPNEIPIIDVHSLPMVEEELRAFHDHMDVFCSSSRGEGWGLPLFEAAVMGKTLITPVETGECQYLAGDRYDIHALASVREVDTWPTPCFWGRGKPTFRAGRLAGETASAVPGQTCKQTWLEIDVCDMAERMRSVYEQHLVGHRFPVAQDRTLLEERFGYDVVAPELVKTLEEMIR